jgi:hypothetical protein
LLGRLAIADGAPATARGLLVRAVAIWEKQPGRDAALADALIHLAIATRAAGELAAARAHADRAATLARSLSDPKLEARALREEALAAAALAGRGAQPA